MCFTGKLSSDYGLLSKMKSNLEDFYLNIKHGMYFDFFEKLRDLKTTYCKKELYLVKSGQWASMNQNGSAAVPNFGRDCTLDWKFYTSIHGLV